ncbi:MAG: TonB-dependent receptor [Bacteroidia bacterium]|nr:TonB-dependent receptor [Bacteroidia bacterium]
MINFRFLFLSGILLAGVQLTYSQQLTDCNFALSGVVSDVSTREPLAFVNVYVPELQKGTVTDSLGRYFFEGICEGSYTLSCTHINCDHQDTGIIVKENTIQNIALRQKPIELAAVEIFGEKIPPPPTQSLSRLTRRELTQTQGKPLADALSSITGVNVLHTGATISKPIIHGLHSSRILILTNGIRLEGQQWGSEHAPEIDPFIATQLTVLKGAGTVQYGVGAMAGVILVEPAPLRDQKGLGGEVNLVGFSNGRTGITSGILEGNHNFLPNWSWRLQGTVKKGGNLHTPGYFLENTGVAEQNFSATLGYKTPKKGLEVYFSRFHNRLGILAPAHLGGQSDLLKALESPKPLGADTAAFSYKISRPFQDITHNLLKWKGYYRINEKNKLSLTYALQGNRRFEFDKHRPRGVDANGKDLPELDFRINTHSLDGVWEFSASKGVSGSTGISGIYQNNYLRGRPFIPNYIAMSGGIFGILRWKKERIEFESGFRHDYFWINSAREESGVDIFSIRTYQSPSATLGVIWKIAPGWEGKIHLGTAWRPPHVNELFSDGLHHGAAALQYGDSTLSPEKAFKTITTLNYAGEKFNAEISAYSQWFRNFIFLRPEGIQTTIRGAFPAFSYAQTAARLIGTDVSFNYRFSRRWVINSRGSWLHAQNLTEGDPLIYMPANWMENSLTYEWANRKKINDSYITIKVRSVARQTRVPEGQDFLPPPGGYTLTGLEAGTKISFPHNELGLSLSAFNLMNITYRDYMDSFRYFADAPGRNISLKINLKF